VGLYERRRRSKHVLREQPLLSNDVSNPSTASDSIGDMWSDLTELLPAANVQFLRRAVSSEHELSEAERRRVHRLIQKARRQLGLRRGLWLIGNTLVPMS
jgi:hypothetical protein